MKGYAYFFSPGVERYRYWLKRIWGENEENILPIVGLNPSFANEVSDDPTITKCIGFSQQRGYDGLIMLNIFALISTDPKRLFLVDDPIGKENDNVLKEMLKDRKEVLVCWGASRKPDGREKVVLSMIENPICLGKTKEGHPRHPLMLPYSTKFEPFN